MTTTSGIGGLPKVALAAADGSATAEIYLHGATLTSWTVDGVERLFLSPNAVFAPPKAIRGGVPVCWPQFGMLGPLKAQHGFARNVRWEVAAVAAGGAACTLACESSAATLAEWPHPFRLEMEVSLLASGALKQELRVLNTGGEPFEFTAALHTYFAVSDIANVSVVGLKGLPYVDNTTSALHTDEAAAVTFPGEVDRAYLGAPPLLKIQDAARDSLLLLHTHGFADAVVWNPAEAKAAGMGDLGAGSWRGFVCVEAAQACSGAVTLAPGGKWVASVEYEADSMGES